MKTAASRPTLLRGFSLIELMVTTAVLSVILILAFSLLDQTIRLVGYTRTKVEAFQGARTAFEVLGRNVSQAQLNTYWDYSYPGGNQALPPEEYVRQSELHFLSMPVVYGNPANELNLTKADSTPLVSVTHGLFFQSPRGFCNFGGTPAITAKLDYLLNACGYYIEFGSDVPLRPSFLTSSVIKPRYRFRLMELLQPSEELRVYPDLVTFRQSANASLLNKWFKDPLIAPVPASHVIAENIIALVILPRRSLHDVVPSGAPPLLAPDYKYDSRLYLKNPGDLLAGVSRNQLPPLLDITMVAIDESSALRMQGSSTAMPAIPVSGGKNFSSLFLKASEYDDDMAALETGLRSKNITYRVFRTSISILQAKWSE